MIYYLLAWLLAFIPPSRGLESGVDRAQRLAFAWVPLLVLAAGVAWVVSW